MIEDRRGSRGARTAAAQMYAVLLLAYPPAFRRRFGASMTDGFVDRCAGAARQGRLALVRVLIVAYLDAIVCACVLWAAAVRDRVLWPDVLADVPSNRRTTMWWQSLFADVRYALRMFRRTPLFTALGVAALALGIGANTAIFSVVNGVLLRPLPYAHPDRLVMIWSTNAREHRDRDAVSPLDLTDFRKAKAFSAVESAYSFVLAGTWTSDRDSEPITLTCVTPGLFELLGRAPVLGRFFTPDEAQTAVVISYDFWQKRLGGDPAVLGRTLDILYQPRVVVGVMPRDFVFPYRAMLGPTGFSRSTAIDVWLPLAFVDARSFTRATGTMPLSRGVRMLTVVARLNDGVTTKQAQAEVSAIAGQLATSLPDTNTGIGAAVVPVHEQAVGAARPALLMLLFGVGLVLLMACVNLANMLLARSAARQRELAIRAALGACRSRLIAQTLVESVLLGSMGGLVALAFLRASLNGMLALAPAELPRVGEIHANGTVLLFAAGLSVLTGVVIGLVPAISSSRPDVNSRLKQSSRSATSGRGPRRVRAALVILEAALAVVLTIGAGLLMRSFVSILSVDPGFEVDHLLTLQLSLPPEYDDTGRRRTMYADLASRLTSIPGVTAIGGTTRLPLGSTNVSSKILIEGRDLPPAQWPEAEFRRSVFEYFSTMRIPVLRGRSFTAQDGPNAPSVCLVNATMARQMFPGEDVLGKRIKFGTVDGPWTTIVGVVGDIRHSALDASPEPEVYVNYLSNPPSNPFIVLRTTGDPEAIAPAVRAQLQALDKDIAPNDIRPMSAVLSDSIAERRFILMLATVFGLLALVMAAVGVYGVMSLVVSERAAEMAIRLALGANPSGVLVLVVREGLSLAFIGALGGIAAAAAVSPFLASQLFGVRPEDPITFVGVPLLVLGIAALACVVSAFRTMRIDPVGALRVE